MTRLRGALAGVLVLPLLTGCLVVGAVNAINDGSLDAGSRRSTAPVSTDPRPSSTAPATAKPASSPTSRTTTPSLPAAPPTLPTGSKWATVDSEQVRFAVPAAWVEINPAALQNAPSVPSEITTLAKKLGITTKELLSRFEDVELAYLAAPVNGYSSNVATMSEEIASLPDDEWVTQTYAAAGKITVTGTSRPTTPAGPGLRINGTVNLSGVTINLTTLIVDLGRSCLILEVAGRKRAEVDQVVSTLTSTLHSL